MLKYFNTASGKIACWTGNSGEGDREISLVFIHGSGSNHSMWSHQYAKLHKKYNVFALDLPGHGGSSGSGENKVENYAHAVKELLDELKLSPPVVVGHSLGAAIALQMALLYQREIAGIVPVGGGITMPVNPLVFAGLKTNPAETIDLICKFSLAKENREKLLKPLQKSLAQSDIEVLQGDLTACAGLDLTAEIAKINIPVFVICGADDKMTPPVLSEELQAGIAGAKLCFIAGAGHMPMLEKPETFNEELIKFVAGLEKFSEKNKL